MASNDRIPTLKEALRETSDYEIPENRPARRKVDPGDAPPPPGDWTTHPVTRVIVSLLALALFAVGVWKGPDLVKYFMEHRFGFWLTVIIVVVLAIIISTAYWRHRTEGEVGWVSRTMDRKRKPK